LNSADSPVGGWSRNLTDQRVYSDSRQLGIAKMLRRGPDGS
jgi:hypothetical protein